MAYSKTPAFDTHKQVELPFVGNRSITSNAGYDTQYLKGISYINCEPRTSRQWGTDPQRVLMSRPVVTANATYSAIESVYKSQIDALTGVAGLYFHQSTNVVRNSVNIVTGLGAGAYVTFCDYLIGTTGYVCILAADGTTNSTLYLFNVSTGVVTTVSLGFVAARGVPPVFMDGYLFILGQATTGTGSLQRIYNCAVGNPTSWTPANDFIDAEMFPDNARYIARLKSHIVVFSDSSIEFFYNNSYQLGSPLQRQASYALKTGLYSIGNYPSVVTIGDTIYFLSVGPAGQILLARIENYQLEFLPDVAIQMFFTGNQYINTLRMHPVNINGTPCLWMSFTVTTDAGVTGPTINHYIFNPIENVTWFWEFGTKTSNGAVLETSVPVGIVDQGPNQSIVYGPGANATISSDYNSTYETFTASYTTDLFDMASQNPKHIKWFDIQGEFKGHTATLYWTKNQNYATLNLSGTLSTLLNPGPNRWRNITRARNVAFKVKITGSYPWLMRRMELAYNAGTA